jgi:predicted glutamine amidotransferase
MCRWAAWLGAPIFIDQVVSLPSHSLIHQSMAAEQSKIVVNADGFGLAWYGERAEPGLYRDVFPAWSDPNLRSITAQVRSHLFLAHVRASTGTATSRNNCHPFTCGRWSFMHNGQIGGFDGMRRDADMAIPDDLYDQRKGATDSEALFLIAVAEGLDSDPIGAISRATARLEQLSQLRGRAPHMRIAAAFSDGKRMYALRYSSDQKSPTVFHRWNDQLGGRAVVSEPLETGELGWQVVPEGTLMIFEGREMTCLPFAPSLHEIAAQ